MDAKGIRKQFKRNKITVLLISFYSGVIGISDLGLKYYLKDQMNPSQFTKILLLIKVAYLIKPIYGLLIDFVPIFGYRKKVYLFICFLINIISWYLFIFKINNNLIISIICHFIINISISFTAVIGNSLQVEISKLQDNKYKISDSTSNFISQKYLIKAIGTLIPSFFKGFLIEKYSIDIIFYLCGIFSFIILLSGIVLKEVKNTKIRKTRSRRHIFLTPLEEEEQRDKGNNKLLNLIKNNNILIFFLLVFILESSPSCASPLFFYEVNVLKFDPKDLGLIDYTSQIVIILFILVYKHYLKQYNFKLITFFVRIFIFGSFFLIYLLVIKRTQKYINDFILLTFSSSLYAGLHNLGQLPYNFLCIKFSSFGLEGTTDSLSICFLYLGNMFADYIDYHLSLYFNVNHYDFTNLGKLVFVENIINLIPLIYIWVIPIEFFSADKGKVNKSSTELSSSDKNNIENNINEQKNGQENNIEDNNADIVDSILQNLVNDDSFNNHPENQLSLEYYNSYRYINFE